MSSRRTALSYIVSALDSHTVGVLVCVLFLRNVSLMFLLFFFFDTRMWVELELLQKNEKPFIKALKYGLISSFFSQIDYAWKYDVYFQYWRNHVKNNWHSLNLSHSLSQPLWCQHNSTQPQSSENQTKSIMSGWVTFACGLNWAS